MPDESLLRLSKPLHYNIVFETGEKSVILVKTDRGFDIYSVENNGDDEITQDEVKYLGGVNAQSGFHLGDGNLVLA